MSFNSKWTAMHKREISDIREPTSMLSRTTYNWWTRKYRGMQYINDRGEIPKESKENDVYVCTCNTLCSDVLGDTSHANNGDKGLDGVEL